MKIQKVRQFARGAALSVILVFSVVGAASAATSSSSHYSVTETQFGAGSNLNSCSSSYCAKTSAGDLTVGSAKSTNYSARFGFNTTPEPFLEVYATGGSHDLGILDENHTATTTNVITVRNYLSNGYVMQITGSSPSQGLHALKTMSTGCPCTSQQGAEQFGINLAANTSPSVGAAPVQVPDSTFAYGYATSDYGTANLFKYVDGDIVARSDKSSGETDYTLSMLFNVSNVTAGGRYTGNFSAVVVATF